MKKLTGGFDNGLGAVLIGEHSLASLLSKKSREGISGLCQQYRPIADDTDAVIGAEFERASVNVPALLMWIMACLLWIDVPSPNQAGIGSMPESVGRGMILPIRNARAPSQPDEDGLFSSPR